METMTTTQNDLATAQTKLERSLGKTSLGSLVKSRRRSMLLVDTSGSMSDQIWKTGERKIDALRTTVSTLRKSHPVPVAAFGGRAIHLVEDRIPDPAGNTPLTEAIKFGHNQGATHLVVVTDGQPSNEWSALEVARAFGGIIDVFYIGDENGFGLDFAKRLAAATGGSVNLTDINAPKELAAGIAGLLGEGSN